MKTWPVTALVYSNHPRTIDKKMWEDQWKDTGNIRTLLIHIIASASSLIPCRAPSLVASHIILSSSEMGELSFVVSQ